jgi:hypothetical protein
LHAEPPATLATGIKVVRRGPVNVGDRNVMTGMLNKVIGVVMILSWCLFLFLDHHFQKVVSQAVLDRNGSYGELYGPLSFFRPAALILSLVLTLATAIMLVSVKPERSE